MCVEVSYTRAQGWVTELQKQEGPNIVIALAGNKADLNDLRAVEAEVTVSLRFLSRIFFCVKRLHIL